MLHPPLLRLLSVEYLELFTKLHLVIEQRMLLETYRRLPGGGLCFRFQKVTSEFIQ